MSSFFRVLLAVLWLGLFPVAPGCTAPHEASIDSNRFSDASVVDPGPQPDAGVAPGADAAVAPVACTAGTCELEDAASCPAPERCLLTGAAPACVAGVAGTLPAGANCQVGDCGEGLACFLLKDGHGVCARPCCPGNASCEVGEACVGGGALASGSVSDWWHCTLPRACVPLEEGSCASGEGCYIVSPEGRTECRRAGTLALGQPCVYPHECQPGLFCGGISRTTCQRLCAIGDAAAGCPDDEGSCWGYGHTPVGIGLCTRR